MTGCSRYAQPVSRRIITLRKLYIAVRRERQTVKLPDDLIGTHFCVINTAKQLQNIMLQKAVED